MDQPFQGFQANQQMGLFTFYRMQEPLIRNQKKLPAIDMKNAKSKLISTPKIIERDQNIQPAAKRRVQSVADCRKKDDQSICKRAVNRYAKLQNKKLSEMAGQQKHSIIDFSFDFSPKTRKNAGKQLFQSTISHRLKTTNPESIKEEAQLFEIQESHYFHSVNLIKINQIKKEQMIELFQSQKDKDDYKKLKIKHKAEFQKPMTLNKQQIEDNYAGQMSFLKNLKKEKPETLNFLQFLQQKKKKMTEQYKKVRLNKKISDILKIKVNQQCPVKLKRVGFDRSQISYIIPNVNYPVCQ